MKEHEVVVVTCPEEVKQALDEYTEAGWKFIRIVKGYICGQTANIMWLIFERKI